MNLRTLSTGVYAVESEGVVVLDGSASAFRVRFPATFVLSKVRDGAVG